jgi:hypothetical protein
MTNLLKYLGWLALVGTFLAPLLFFSDRLGEAGLRTSLLICMVLWFTVAVIRDRQNRDANE